MNIFDEALNMKDEIIAIRRDLHRHPELGLEEFRTSSIVAETLKSLGMAVQTGIAETGVIGMLHGKKESPVLLMRFDMDALPIQEDTGAEYASEKPGKMHACGHDGHVAVGLSVAKLLTAHTDQLEGSIKFVFQPGEEGAGGGQKMVAEGVLENPHADFSIAMHVWNQKPLGWYGLNPGPTMAGAEIFFVTVTGKGGHGASPHNSIDPVVATAQIVNTLQTIVARNVNPLDSAVVTVGKIAAGTAFNIIPQNAYFEGTIRTFKPEVTEMVNQRFTEIVENTAKAMGCDADSEIIKVTYPVINDPALTALISDVVTDLDPRSRIDSSFQTMGSEDFSFMMQGIPSCFIMVGSGNVEKGLIYDHHHPKFNFDEDCLPNAVGILAQSAIRILKTKN